MIPTIPPSPSRVFGYRAWFAAILFLEYAIVRKQIQAYMAFETFRANPRHMRHPWVSIATHVAVDSIALWFMNAFPGSSRCGTRRAAGGEKEKEKEKRILRVPVSVPILARHAAKMCSRVQPVVITLLGASVFHGYTLKQTLLMVLSPTFFNVVGGATGRNALAAMSAATSPSCSLSSDSTATRTRGTPTSSTRSNRRWSRIAPSTPSACPLSRRRPSRLRS